MRERIKKKATSDRPRRVDEIDALAAKLPLNPDKLEEHLCEHPVLFYRIGRLLSEANAQVAALRDRYKEVAATAAASIRAELLESTGKRPTEAQVLSLVDSDDGYMLARQRHQKATGEAERLLALKEAFQTRGYLLRSLVEIHVTEHYQSQAPRRR